MDGTPYPPPAPSVPPAGVPQAPYPATQPAAQPPKKKTGLIIGIVVAVLLLCCCGSSITGYLVYKNAKDTADEAITDLTTDLDSNLDSSDSNSNTDEGEGASSGPASGTGWESFSPTPFDTSVWVSLEPFHREVLDEAAHTLYPDFEINDAVVRYSDEYTTDLVLGKASFYDDPDVQIAFYLEVENAEAFAEGWTNDPTTDADYMDSGMAANGHEYFWDIEQLVPLMGGISDSSTSELLSQVASDFPGCVICLLENDGSTAYVEFTTWEAYPDYSEGFSAYYSFDGSDWGLDSAEEW